MKWQQAIIFLHTTYEPWISPLAALMCAKEHPFNVVFGRWVCPPFPFLAFWIERMAFLHLFGFISKKCCLLTCLRPKLWLKQAEQQAASSDPRNNLWRSEASNSQKSCVTGFPLCCFAALQPCRKIMASTAPHSQALFGFWRTLVGNCSRDGVWLRVMFYFWMHFGSSWARTKTKKERMVRWSVPFENSQKLSATQYIEGKRFRSLHLGDCRVPVGYPNEGWTQLTICWKCMGLSSGSGELSSSVADLNETALQRPGWWCRCNMNPLDAPIRKWSEWKLRFPRVP